MRLGYNQGVEPEVRQQVAQIERRCRTLTGIVLAVLAFLASYGIMLFEGQVERPAFHFYPWLLAVLCYLGGDLLAWIWFRVVLSQLATLLAAQRSGLLHDDAEPATAGRTSELHAGDTAAVDRQEG